MPKTILPAAVVVSMEAPWPVSTLKPTPRVASSCTVLTRTIVYFNDIAIAHLGDFRTDC